MIKQIIDRYYKPGILCVLLLFTGTGLRAQFTSSNLPIILIETDQGVPVTKEKIDAMMKITFHLDQRNYVTGPYNNYDGLISIKGRGSSSWERYEKKGYTLETRLATGENNNVPLLGLPAENDWVLHGPYADKTLIKNAFVYTIGAELGRYAPRHHFCELVLNGEYRGVYLLVERIKRDSNRVDIATLNPDENTGDDLTGGYIMRIDRVENEYSWKADFGYDLSYFNYYYPDALDMSSAQRDYIRGYINQFEYALTSRPLFDVQNGYRRFINVASFIDYFIISELTKNIDAYRLSTYFYKDKDSKGGKLTMGPIWDFNLSCGGINIGYGDWGAIPYNWVSDELPGGVPFWWNTFLQDPYYNSCLKERWNDLRQDIINENHFNSIIDNYATLLDEAKERNFEIFPLAEPVWGNNHSGLTYPEEIGMLKNFMAERIAWMDMMINNLPAGQACSECFTDCTQPPILGIKSELIDFSIYPNPATDKLYVQLSAPYPGIVNIEIRDIAGRLVIRGEMNSQQDKKWLIDLGTISQNGIFVYKVYSPGVILGTGTFIKE